MNAVPGPEELKALIRPEGRIEAERSLYCQRYGPCLDEAVRRGWASWTCAGCPLFGDEAGVSGSSSGGRH